MAQPLPPGAVVRAFTRDEVSRAAGPQLLGPDGMPLGPRGALAWMGPGRPITPVAPPEDVAGRAYDYPQTHNLNVQPRSFERVNFKVLRELADGYDLLRLAIETRKDQMAELGWSVQPRKKHREQFRPKSDARCDEAEKFFRKPDGEHYWDQWMRILSEEQLVIDAPAIYRRLSRDGTTVAAEIVAGDTITPLLDHTGRMPRAPDPAFQHVLKGLPAVNYTSDELLYVPRNPRANTRYGKSPVEQVIITVNIGLRRMLGQLHHYTEGNVPEALIGLPESWTVDQIKGFQAYWDMLMADPAIRRRARFVPGQFAFQPTRNEGGLMDAYDEWLARVICYALSLPPLPFVKVMNRSTAETSYDAALREGLAPLMKWAKNIHDDIIANWLGYPDLEWVWDDVRQLDPTEQLQVDLQEMQRGIRGLDDIRASRGLDATGLGPVVYGVGPLGFMPVEQMVRAIEMGLTMPQPPPPPDMMMGHNGGPGGPMPGEEDPLANASPELLAQLGIAPGGAPEGEGDWEQEEGQAGPGPAPAPAAPGFAPAVARRLPAGDPRGLVRQMLGRRTVALGRAAKP